MSKDNIKATGLNYLGNLPADPQIEALSLSGGSIFELNPNAQAFVALNSLGEQIWKHN